MFCPSRTRNLARLPLCLHTKTVLFRVRSGSHGRISVPRKTRHSPGPRFESSREVAHHTVMPRKKKQPGEGRRRGTGKQSGKEKDTAGESGSSKASDEDDVSTAAVNASKNKVVHKGGRSHTATGASRLFQSICRACTGTSTSTGCWRGRAESPVERCWHAA